MNITKRIKDLAIKEDYIPSQRMQFLKKQIEGGLPPTRKEILEYVEGSSFPEIFERYLPGEPPLGKDI